MINYFYKKHCILSLLLAVLVIFVICACENPWMKEIMQEKTISFDTNGGSTIPSQTLYSGERVTRPANPDKSGSVFLDWYKDNRTFLEPYDFSFIPKQDMTLYARWDTSEVITPGTVFDDLDTLRAWLSVQNNNTPDKPYQITLKVDSIAAFASTDTLDSTIAGIIDEYKKYVSIELVGNKLTTIGDAAFYECKYLTGITIPDGVTTIGEYAFFYCTNLTSVKFEGADVTFGIQSFVDIQNTTSLQTVYTASPGGGAGTYTRPNTSSNEWTRKP